jgi:N-methylhydantoinase B
VTRSHKRTADPITTEVIRNGLVTAAEHMKVVLCRAAYSPIIYEMYDFACALFDRQVRVLGQGRGMPLFLGTLGPSVVAMVEAVGGEGTLRPGDVLFSTYGFDIGSHQQDAAVVLPGFHNGNLIGYAAVKAHHLDIGAKAPYCTDTTDVFQEGVIFPGVKLWREGVRQHDLYRTLVANSRLPQALEGDLNAEIAAATVGLEELTAIVERYGRAVFDRSVEAMFDHGEALVRSYLETVPDGRYVGGAALDDNGVDGRLVPFELVVEKSGTGITVDFTTTPPQQVGPVNCPYPATLSAARCALMALVGGAEDANEGHFRPLSVLTKPGTLFHPEPPAPLFIFGAPAIMAVDVIHRALADALPGQIPAGSGGDICSFMMWGEDGVGALWITGCDHTVGQGASSASDGGAPLIVIATSGERNIPVEVLEARFPFLVEKLELAIDSGGPGHHRGGLGVDQYYRALRPFWLTSAFERCKTPPWGLKGGADGRSNSWGVRDSEGVLVTHPKLTGLPIPAGARVEVRTGGGGGWGDPSRRGREDVLHDVKNGYVSAGAARRDYPHVWLTTPQAGSAS